jgi:hypothetical protein
VTAQASGAAGAWRRHRQWSAVANRRRTRIDRWRLINLGLLIAGAILGAVAAQPSWSRDLTTVAAGVGAFALGAAGIVQQRFLNAGEVARWTGARAASEGLKAEVFRYLAKVAPYDGDDPDGVLQRQVAAIQDKAGGSAIDQQQSPADDKKLPDIRDFPSYVDNRARQQANWHRNKIAEHLKAAGWIRAFELVATVVAALLSAIVAARYTNELSAWIGVATTIGAALAAHLSATEHDRIAASYATTADRLDLLIEDLPARPDAATQAQFVTNVETRLAVQNETWLALFPPK